MLRRRSTGRLSSSSGQATRGQPQSRVSMDMLATFRECLWTIGGYNEFDPGAVSDALADVLPGCAGVEIGREFSPVIYVSIPRWAHHTFTARETGQPDDRTGERITEDDREALAARVMAAGRAAGADEVDVRLVHRGRAGHHRKHGH